MKHIKESLYLFLIFFKIGLFTFGGGLAMISLIEREFSTKRSWIDKEELVDMIAISESTPGPLAINMATYVGNKIGGIFGSILATIGVVLPSFFIILLISLVLDQVMDYEMVQHAFLGINCAVGILILLSGISLLKTLPKQIESIIMFILAILSTVCILFFSIDFSTIYLILIGALVGLLSYALRCRGKHQREEKQ